MDHCIPAVAPPHEDGTFPLYPLIELCAEEACPGGPTYYLLKRYALEHPSPLISSFTEDPKEATRRFHKATGGHPLDKLPAPFKPPSPRRK